MGAKERFTDEEWKILVNAPFLIGLTVSDFDLNPDSSEKEFNAILEACADCEADYADNELIQEVLAEVGGASNMSQDDEDTGKKRKDIVAHFADVGRLLERKCTTTEGQQFKEFLYEIAVRVAAAYGEGFLGLGKKVSIKEEYMIEKLQKALNL